MKSFFSLLFIFYAFSTFVCAQIIEREDVVFRSEGRILSGKMIYPAMEEPIPFLVFVGGEEAFHSFDKDYRAFLQENFEDALLTQNIGFLYIDTRGIGNSEGRWQRADFYDRANDVKAGLDFLKTRQEVQHDRVGVFGHGQGAWIAQIAAAQNPDDVSVLLSLAGPTFDVKTKLTNGFHSRYVCNGRDSTAAHRKAVRQTKSVQGWVNALPWIKKWRQGKVIKDFDPSQEIASLAMPSLFVFAENDREVYPSWAINQLDQLFNNQIPDNITIETISSVNHSFRVAPACYKGSNTKLEFSDVFKEKIHSWVVENL